MNTAPSIRFRNVPRSPGLETEILDRVRKLERFYDRITSCRITLSVPRRHREGGNFHLRIDLAVPGEEIVIDHEADLDPAHEDIHLAIRDGFRAARRRLQDHVRRRREFTIPPVRATQLEATARPRALDETARPASRRHGAREVAIDVPPVRLPAVMTIPTRAQALVIFADEGPGMRSRERGQRESDILHSEHLATLRFHLLTADEQRKKQNAFDVPLLARRLAAATRWAEEQSDVRGLAIGYFGARNGSAAALVAAAGDPAIGAVVSRGGRPGLALESLPFVHAPTLLIAGSEDGPVLTENWKAFAQLAGLKDLFVVEGVSRRFSEPGALEEVARKARSWFVRYLIPMGVVQ